MRRITVVSPVARNGSTNQDRAAWGGLPSPCHLGIVPHWGVLAIRIKTLPKFAEHFPEGVPSTVRLRIPPVPRSHAWMAPLGLLQRFLHLIAD